MADTGGVPGKAAERGGPTQEARCGVEGASGRYGCAASGRADLADLAWVKAKGHMTAHLGSALG